MLLCPTRSSNRVLIGSSVIYSFVYLFDQYLSAHYPDTVLYTRDIAETNTQYLPSKNMWLQTGKW